MRVLVTGENSYAGRQFEKRILELNIDWKIDFVSVRNSEWKTKDFSKYDAIYHVAAIVHQKEKKENESLYYKINRDLTYELALKAKIAGIKTFVFLSTMAVYGLIGKIGEDTVISKDTKAIPTSYYGKSKWEGEELINSLQSSMFNVSILRIPMIYGPNCPGNYRSLSKLAKKTPIFPKINNKRSMIFVNHLSDLVIYIIKSGTSGTILVKNPKDVNTLEMVNEISKVHNKKIYNSIVLAFLIKNLGNRFSITRKMFSSIYYDEINCELNNFDYNPLSFEKSIQLSEGIKGE